MDIRDIIQRELDRRGMTRSELAKRASMTNARVSDYLNGHRDIYVETLQRIMDVLGLKLKANNRKGR